MMNARLVTVVLWLDAAANALLAVVVLVAAGPTAHALGGIPTWPLFVLAMVLGANGILCWRAARAGEPDPGLLRRLAVVDALFVIAVVGIAVADPTGAATWLRWALGALGAVVGIIAEIKWFAAGRRSTGAVVRG